MPAKSHDSTAKTFEAMYDHYMVALTLIGTSQFGMRRADAENLAHDILIASLGSMSRIADLRTWLTASMLSAAQRETNARKE
jgi:DNA-directed RNA polymerase specialized sigma24 family protein